MKKILILLILTLSFISAFSLSADNTAGQMSNVNDITIMELKAFEEGRSEKYEGRPKPASMDFDDDIFEKYLNALPVNLRATEKLRYSTVKNIKSFIVRVLERSPYSKGLKTRKGNKRGVVYMANIHGLRLKKSTRSKKGKSYKWKELKFEQYPEFMEYFAKRRLGISGAGQLSKKKLKQDAAMEYLGMAILCDWFGHYKNALKHAKRAVKICPDIKIRVSRMMLR